MTPPSDLLGVVRECGLPATAVHPHRGTTDELDAPWLSDKYAGSLAGTHPLLVRLDDGATVDVVLKVRSDAGIGRTLMPGVYERLGIDLPRPYADFATSREMNSVLRREIDVYRLQPTVPALSCQPRRLGDALFVDDDLSALVVEFVADAVLMDTGADVSGWTPDLVARQVDALAAVHAAFLGSDDPPPTLVALPAAFTLADLVADRDLWLAGLEFVHSRRPDLLDDRGLARRLALVDSVGDWWPAVQAHPRTLVHDDANPRNACFRADGRPLVYDWELACWGAPQRDLVEFLTFTVTPGWSDDEILALVDRHRRVVETQSVREVDRVLWDAAFRGHVVLESIDRLVFQQVLGAAMPLGYVERISAATERLLGLVGA